MMEKYAFYLLGAYGVFALAIALEIVLVRARLKRARARLAGATAP
ncbi:MAG: heme exporter protein CcmD [Burkholderiales bacterium]|jgi:heme exporter protein CcmD